MKNIEIDDDLYHYIASKTEYIGESASAILRRLLALDAKATSVSGNQAGKSNETVKPVVKKTETVFDFINREELAAQRGAVGRFLIILAALYRVHKEDFDGVLSIRGRDRLYFSTSEQEIEDCGNSTKPRQIPNSPYWVITNSNTTRKKMMLTEVANLFGYSEAQVEKIRDLL